MNSGLGWNQFGLGLAAKAGGPGARRPELRGNGGCRHRTRSRLQPRRGEGQPEADPGQFLGELRSVEIQASGVGLSTQVILVFGASVIIFGIVEWCVLGLAIRVDSRDSLAAGLGWVGIGIINLTLVFVGLPLCVLSLWKAVVVGAPETIPGVWAPISAILNFERNVITYLGGADLGSIASALFTIILNFATLIGGVSGAIYLVRENAKSK